MDNFTIVRPEHLNHYGFLFGGAMLKWVDEFAWLVASRDFPGYPLVTRAMDGIEFREKVSSGAILRFRILPASRGTSSITYSVEVFSDEPDTSVEKKVFTTRITFVAVAEDGTKRELPGKGALLSET